MAVSRIYKTIFEFADDAVDDNRHVNNVEYVRRLQEVAIEHTRQNGWPPERLFTCGWTWVVRSHYIEYLLPAQAGEKIALYTWVSNMRRIRSLRKYRFVRVSDGAVLANAQTEWVFIDFLTGRPRTIPNEIILAYDQIPESEEPSIGHTLRV